MKPYNPILIILLFCSHTLNCMLKSELANPYTTHEEHLAQNASTASKKYQAWWEKDENPQRKTPKPRGKRTKPSAATSNIDPRTYLTRAQVEVLYPNLTKKPLSPTHITMLAAIQREQIITEEKFARTSQFGRKMM